MNLLQNLKDCYTLRKDDFISYSNETGLLRLIKRDLPAVRAAEERKEKFNLQRMRQRYEKAALRYRKA